MDKPCHLNRTDESDEDEEYDRENAFGISMTINEVKNAIDEFKGRDFAGLFQNEVVKRLIQISLANWKEPTIKCLDETDKAIIATIESICRDYKRFPTLQGHLRYVHYSFVLQSNNIISIRSLSILAGVKSETREHLNRLLEIERMCISLNDHYLLATQKIFSDMLTSVFSNTKPVANGDNMKNAVYYLAAAGITGLTASQIIDRLTDLKDESYKEPIEVFARVKSYLKVAYKRHVDNVAAGIISEFVCKFSRILGEKLPMQLANDEENLINEDTAIVAKRQELLNRKARLSKVKEDLIKSNLI
jgi:hypothetical protein